MSAVTAPGTPSKSAGIVVATAVFTARSLRHSLRDVESLVMGVVLPVMMTVLLTFVFGGAISSREQYLEYVVPGIVMLCAGFGAATTAIAVSTDLSTGAIDRFRTMPIPGWAVLLGHAAASLVRNLFSTAVVGVVAVLLGYRASGGVGGVVAAAAVVALWIAAITVLFTVIGLFAKTPQAASGYGFVFLFLPYLSSAFVPLSTLPAWLRPVAANQPCTPVIESIRALLDGADPGSDLLAAIVWCGGFLVVATLLCVWAFPRKTSR